MNHGFLSIDKPAGMTSHDVVAKVRRLAKQKRVGHAGTLDPAATGVLVVALGQATRLIEYVQDGTDKRYDATVRLGITTTTDDAEGETVSEQPVPALGVDTIEAALVGFRGPIQQVPPMYSALHHDGKRLYELARQGITLDLPARPVTIHELHLVHWQAPDLVLDVRCSKGTYIRSLARDIGAALGCGAHLAALRRTAVGSFALADAVPLAALLDGACPLETALLPPAHAVAGWQRITLDDAGIRRIRNGLPVSAELDADEAQVCDTDGTLVALVRRTEQGWQPDKVFDWSASA